MGQQKRFWFQKQRKKGFGNDNSDQCHRPKRERRDQSMIGETAKAFGHSSKQPCSSKVEVKANPNVLTSPRRESGHSNLSSGRTYGAM